MKHRLLANSINSNGGDISAERNIVRNGIEALTDVPLDAFITRRQALGILPSTPTSFIILTGDPTTYFLTSDQLSDVNAIGRIPNFVALIAGTPFPDIQPTYTGNAGDYSSISVNVHDDGTGHSPENVLVQFS